MKIYPDLLEKLIDFYKTHPGVGEKSAERMALFALELDDDTLAQASHLFAEVKKTLRTCSVCGNITDNDVCNVCSNPNRNHNVICVVEDYKSAFAFERVGNFKGVYHVLNGLISPIDNVGAEDLNISSLVKRVENLDNPELILALKSSREGEITTLYLKKIFENKNVIISRLSYGLSIGAEIDYLDMMTLDRALEDRKQIS